MNNPQYIYSMYKLSKVYPGGKQVIKDMSLSFLPGAKIGVLGGNGAGKSTLLKVLSRITSPTMGKIKLSGKIASLLEVGTGFHPELTGRENIFLNGAINGMKKSDVSKKIDEIVMTETAKRIADARATDEGKEGTNAFLNKIKPGWQKND